MLLQIRRLFEQENKRNRPGRMEPEEIPFAGRYEIDDDDFEFEEEIGARQLRERQSGSQQNSEGPTTPPPEPSQNGAAAAAEPRAQGSVPPSDGQVAAE